MRYKFNKKKEKKTDNSFNFSLLKAIEMLGGQSMMGKMLNRHQSTISRWLNMAVSIPPEIALKIEKLTKSIITRYDLRPDLYPRD